MGVLQAGYYGVPQSRVRVIIWAAKCGEILPDYPRPTHDFPLHYKRTLPKEYYVNYVGY